MNELLDISSLTLDLDDGRRLLHDISLRVGAGETVGLVGESGSGKSLTSRAILGLQPKGAQVGGSLRIEGKEVVGAAKLTLLSVRREQTAMIFQDPRAGINAMRTIGDHMTESLILCQGVPAVEARSRAIDLLGAVRLPNPKEHFSQHPHEFSGGMLQRVMIAGALTSSPRLLICDEPTTALDVTTQAEILQVLLEQRDARGMGMLFITHDLHLAASICDRVYVMNQGRVEEDGTAREVFLTPSSDYTKKLIAATPSIDAKVVPDEAADDAAPDVASPDGAHPGTGGTAQGGKTTGAGAASVEPLLDVQNLVKIYHPRGREPVAAVSDVSLRIDKGASLGVVGESGSGKSTLARLVVGLESPDSGHVRIAGQARAVVPKSRRERLERARNVQMVFQDPYLSLDPRIPVSQSIEDIVRLHTSATSAEARRSAGEMLEAVGLQSEFSQALPRTLSGGQRQRVAIARAIAIEPALLVLDEATSALDVSVQAQVLDMLDEVRQKRGLTVLFISHDLGVVREVCDQTLVMKRGELVESGETERLLSRPEHEYTRLLIDSVPRPAWL